MDEDMDLIKEIAKVLIKEGYSIKASLDSAKLIENAVTKLVRDKDDFIDEQLKILVKCLNKVSNGTYA